MDLYPGSLVEFVMNETGQIVLRKAGVKDSAPHPFDPLVGSLGPGMTTDELMVLTRGEN